GRVAVPALEGSPALASTEAVSVSAEDPVTAGCAGVKVSTGDSVPGLALAEAAELDAGAGAGSPPEAFRRCCRAALIARPACTSQSLVLPFRPQSGSDRLTTGASAGRASGAVVGMGAAAAGAVVVARAQPVGSEGGRLSRSEEC